MTEDLLRQRLQRSEARVRALEDGIEERTRELFLALDAVEASASFMREVMTAVPSAIFVFDGSGEIQHANSAAASLLGVAADVLAGQPVARYFPDGEAPDIGTIAARHGTAGSGVPQMERTMITATGERIPVHLSTALLHAPAGMPLVAHRAVGVAVDVRTTRQLEVELRQAQKLEAVGRLAAGVAHEINTPVQFVNDSIVFLRDASDDIARLVSAYRSVLRDVQKGRPVTTRIAEVAALEDEVDLEYIVENVPKAFERSVDGLDRVATIVRSMKEFSHPDTKDRKQVDINRGLESVITLARNEYKYVADVETHFGELPKVLCHAGEVNQVLLNIVVNAAHAIAERVAGTDMRGRITIRTAAEGERVRISISDTGTGIPEAIRERIFDPFFTTKDVGQGTGQGLAFARTMIVDRHQGALEFESTLGEGTTFHILLPVTPATAEACA